MSPGRGALDRVCALVRDELAAVETYRLALDKLGDLPESADLRRIQNDHEEAVSLLQEKVASAGVEPPTRAGAWGLWLRSVEGAAQLIGERTALKALRAGEETDIADYEEALDDLGLDYETKQMIGAHLLPKTRSHLPLLDQYLREGGGGLSYHSDQGKGPDGEGRGV